MIVNHSRRFIFYHVPKAAGTSVRDALLSVPGSRKPRGTKHLTPEEFQNSLGWLRRWRIRSYSTFCFVRNPWERFGSLHRYVLGHSVGQKFGCPTSVNDFAIMLEDRVKWVMELRSIRLQVSYADQVGFVGRFETLERDFADICGQLGVNPSLGHLNASGKQVSYLGDFTPRTVDILSDFYQPDIERFGYRLPA